MRKLNTQKGITLIALIITIIVMLILVGVSVTVTLKGGLFKTAQDAVNNTRAERDNEIKISNGDIIDEYLSGEGNGTESKDWTIEGDLEIGSLVTHSSGEEFYIIGGDEVGTEITTTTETIILLAENCIDTTTKKQSASAGKVKFSERKYWSNDADDLVELTEDDIALKYAYEYGVAMGGNGRLMLHSEVHELDESGEYSDMLYGTDGAYLYYWIGSLNDAENGVVWIVDGNMKSLGLNCIVWQGYSKEAGVRPVVEISKFEI